MYDLCSMNCHCDVTKRKRCDQLLSDRDRRHPTEWIRSFMRTSMNCNMRQPASGWRPVIVGLHVNDVTHGQSKVSIKAVDDGSKMSSFRSNNNCYRGEQWNSRSTKLSTSWKIPRQHPPHLHHLLLPPPHYLPPTRSYHLSRSSYLTLNRQTQRAPFGRIQHGSDDR